MKHEEPQPYAYQAWPAHFYGPNGENEIFYSAAEVPAGWHDCPTKAADAKATDAKPAKAHKAPTPPPPPPPPAAPGVAEVDAAGVAWNAVLHAASKGKTKAGLWRMKVGVSRPETAAPLDL